MASKTIADANEINLEISQRLKKYQPEGWYFHFWWAHQDLNLGPKDSGLCNFHYSLDYAFIILIAQLRWVPSSLYTFNSTFILKLGSALAWIFLPLAFSEFDTIPYAVSTHKAQLSL
ncbi:hypothetical protein A9235_08815 [Polynucleobacter sp. MWH-Tro8-2-5-gr]|nr:hypothetical protein A9235_08815 [Polynucleobacter sp. MWH-Tro8-2-5-gr]